MHHTKESYERWSNESRPLRGPLAEFADDVLEILAENERLHQRIKHLEEKLEHGSPELYQLTQDQDGLIKRLQASERCKFCGHELTELDSRLRPECPDCGEPLCSNCLVAFGQLAAENERLKDLCQEAVVRSLHDELIAALDAKFAKEQKEQ